MTLAERLQADLTAAMRRRDAAQVACIRQLRSKVQEAANAPNFKGPVDDALHLQLLASYCKSLQKAIVELAPAGVRSQPLRDSYATEIAYLQQYLPAPLGAAEVTQMASAAIATLGAAGDPKQAGKVLGALMRGHAARLDVSQARQIIAQLLAPA